MAKNSNLDIIKAIEGLRGGPQYLSDDYEDSEIRRAELYDILKAIRSLESIRGSKDPTDFSSKGATLGDIVQDIRELQEVIKAKFDERKDDNIDRIEDHLNKFRKEFRSFQYFIVVALVSIITGLIGIVSHF